MWSASSLLTRRGGVLLALLLLLSFITMMSDAASSSSYRSQTGWWDEVTSLPGYRTQNGSSTLPSRMFSGYVNLSSDHNVLPPALTDATSMFMHYFMFTAEDTSTPAPTIVWWNGGPGASSAWGLFVENGPLLLTEESVLSEEDVQQLILNPYRWTKHANLIAFCNPPPIGFSYCLPAGPTGNGTACGTWNDTRVGIVDAEAIRIVVSDHFPALAQHPIYFMGESYAGVYIGETVQWMLSNPTTFAPVLAKLAGVALGDACLGSDVLCGGASGPYPTLLFFYGHGQVSTELWNWLLTQCTTTELNGRTQSATCTAAINKIYDAVGGYYAYNLVDQCTSDAFSSSRSVSQKERRQKNAAAAELVASSTALGSTIPIPEENGYWCPGQIFFEYFDRADARTATFVPLNSTFFNADDGEGMSYVYNSLSVMPAITALLLNRNPAINQGRPVHVWAFDGDEDPSVNIFSTQEAWWKYATSQTFQKTKEWSSWVINGSTIVGGYSTEWLNGTLSFVSIRGSGHMVAEYKPASALAFLQSFLKGTSLPPYVAPPPSMEGRRRRKNKRTSVNARRRFPSSGLSKDL
ncbi:peptidase, putative [Bodo saltans]|uniref:Peptidase, putative n=1 Tax=Bodo saltans TaxID=75058 RepID=A0A0S4ILE5_BODSA|nr:peptidase, putative [Bodo saltans]|eukprot:CUE71137.1 peptidase, putative [Bodo saltans]